MSGPGTLVLMFQQNALVFGNEHLVSCLPLLLGLRILSLAFLLVSSLF